MISQNDLSIYLAQLPKDLVLIVDNKKYSVNKQIVSTLSSFLSRKIQENESTDSISLDKNDEFNVFKLVSSFLNGGKINITPENDYPLDIFATYLEIQSLKRLTENSLNSPLSVNNVIQRNYFYKISNNEDNPKYLEYFSFFEDNIENIIHYQQIKNKSSNSIFEIDPIFLSKIIHSEKSKFSNLSSRYLFALDCCLHFYPSFLQEGKSFDIFISNDDFEKMPDEVIIQMCSNEKYMALEDQLPALQLAQQLISQINQLQKEIEDTNAQNEEIEQQILRIREENDAIMKHQMSSEAKFNEVSRRRYDISKILSLAATNINQKAPGLTNFIVPNSIIPEIDTTLSNLDQKCSNLKKVLIKISVTKLIFADLRAKGLKLTENFQALLEPMKSLLNVIIPNEEDLNQLVEQFRIISKQLFTMADDLYRLENS